MNSSLILAKHIADTDYDDIPSHVVEITKKSFLDGLGVILAASSAKMLENMMVYEKKVGDDWDIYFHYSCCLIGKCYRMGSLTWG